MSCKISSLLDNKVFFDEDFDWHFYDISFCFRAKKANLNVAVSPIHVLHYALGDSCFSDKFAENQNKFRKKYGTR
jgi:hypothetical protein